MLLKKYTVGLVVTFVPPKVRVGHSQGYSQVICHSIKHLYPIEVSSSEDVVSSESEQGPVSSLDNVT